MRAEVEDLVGKVLVEVILDRQNATIKFVDNTGGEYLMYHEQNCCEGVWIDDICGDLQDLVGTPILAAEEVSNEMFVKDWRRQEKEKLKEADSKDEFYWLSDSYTWTFYKFATINGYVDIRWYGESNGYYSESVDFVKKDDRHDWF